MNMYADFNQIWKDEPLIRLLIVSTIVMAVIVIPIYVYDWIAEKKKQAEEAARVKKRNEQLVTEIMLNNDLVLGQLTGILRSLQTKRAQDYAIPGTEKQYIVQQIFSEKSKSEIEIESMIARLRQNNKHADAIYR